MKKQLNVFGWDEKKILLVSRFISQQSDNLNNAQRTGDFPKYIGRDNVDELIEGLDELVYNISAPVTDNNNENPEAIIRQCMETLSQKQKALTTDLKNIDSAINVLRSELPESEMPF